MGQAEKIQNTSTPSLLRLILNEVDLMNEVDKKDILRKIKMRNGLSLAKEADTILEGHFKQMTEEEIAVMVSNNRKTNYAKQTGH